MKVGIVVPYSWSFWGAVIEHADPDFPHRVKEQREEGRKDEESAGKERSADTCGPAARRF